MSVLGIDIGGSGIKGAPVDTEKGELLAERFRLETPEPSKPAKVAKVVAEVIRHFEWTGPVGCGFPSVVRAGVVFTAANVHKSWIGTDAQSLFQEASGCPVTVINDADAAGLAEMRFGAGKDYQNGTVLMITLGTGIGTALFTDGRLLRNTEFGHISIRGKDAERRASDAARQRKDLSWKAWSKHLNEYLQTMEALFWPDLIIIGGGVSKDHERFFPYLKVHAKMVPAEMLNLSGIIGAALSVPTSGLR